MSRTEAMRAREAKAKEFVIVEDAEDVLLLDCCPEDALLAEGTGAELAEEERAEPEDAGFEATAEEEEDDAADEDEDEATEDEDDESAKETADVLVMPIDPNTSEVSVWAFLYQGRFHRSGMDLRVQPWLSIFG